MRDLRWPVVDVRVEEWRIGDVAVNQSELFFLLSIYLSICLVLSISTTYLQRITPGHC
jgi:hypothetical protein